MNIFELSLKIVTGVGFPSAWQCSSVPDEFENRIFVSGSETNFGPSSSELLTKPLLHDAPPVNEKNLNSEKFLYDIFYFKKAEMFFNVSN